MYYNLYMMRLYWDAATERYIRNRAKRYPGAIGVTPEQAREVLDDIDLVALEPDPKSHIGASRFIGYSPDAKRVLTIIAWRDRDGDLHLVNAWRATGADLRLYSLKEDKEDFDGQDG